MAQFISGGGRWSYPSGRGRFRCELPSAANPNIIQTLYANIGELYSFSPNDGLWLHHPYTNNLTSIPSVRFDRVTLLATGSGIVGTAFSLSCSATLIDPTPLSYNVPSPHFEWLFGPGGSASLPSGVTPMATILMSGNTYFSTLLFSPTLNKFHAGMYTCRLGAGRLVNSTVVSAVKGKLINDGHVLQLL